MKKMLCLALTFAMTHGGHVLAAQAQNPGVITGAVVDVKGVISGTVSSSAGRPLSDITMELMDARGLSMGKTMSARDGGFTLPPVSYDTYTLQCVQKNKVIGTSSVTLKARTESVRITCTSDAAAFWKKPAVIAGLAAAVVAAGATAFVATSGDASGSR
jgi:hypothetical protein